MGENSSGDRGRARTAAPAQSQAGGPAGPAPRGPRGPGKASGSSWRNCWRRALRRRTSSSKRGRRGDRGVLRRSRAAPRHLDRLCCRRAGPAEPLPTCQAWTGDRAKASASTPNKLSEHEVDAILDQLRSPRFVDSSPDQVYFSLLDERNVSEVRAAVSQSVVLDRARASKIVVVRDMPTRVGTMIESGTDWAGALRLANVTMWSVPAARLRGPVAGTDGGLTGRCRRLGMMLSGVVVGPGGRHSAVHPRRPAPKGAGRRRGSGRTPRPRSCPGRR